MVDTAGPSPTKGATPGSGKPGASKPTGAAAPSSAAPATADPAKVGAPSRSSATSTTRSPAPNAPVQQPVRPAPAVGAVPAGTSGPATSDPRLDPRAGSGVAAPAPVAPVAAVRPAGPRRARLFVTRLDPWSVMKSAFMLSVSIGIVTLVAVALLWWSLEVTGVFAAVGRTIDDVAGTGSTSFDFLSLVGFGRVMGVALVLAAVEIVLVSALSTLFAFLYNLSVGLTGGLEVTLSEDG